MEPFVLSSKIDPYLRIETWEIKFPHLVVGMSTRTDQQRNYALHVNDDPQRVIANRHFLTEALSFPFDSWTCGEQVHRAQVAVVNREDRGKGKYSREDAFADTDGLLTAESDILLTSFYADCVPLFFYSPTIDMIGVAHAGWQGTVQQIGVKMVEKMVAIGADKQEIVVAIGPAIGACCYEVDDRVAQPIRQLLPKANSDILQPTRIGHYQLDLKRTNQQLLLEIGLKPEQILVSKRCTNCEDHLFFSHRRQAAQAGRMVAFIGKKGGSFHDN
jgi:YfiH family protein